MIVSVIFAASLAAAQLFLHSHQSFTYYMLPTRAWELMAGGLLALMVFTGIRLNKPWSEVAACIGVVAIGWSLVGVSQNDDVPGLAALPVVLGSVLLLMSGDNTLVGRFLSLKPIVAIGLVSYSAYLWHWPLLAFLRYALITIDLPLMVGVLITTFSLASLSYFVVEKPLRVCKISPRSVFVWYFSVPVVLIASLTITVIHLIAVKNPLLYSWDKYEALKTDIPAANAYAFNCQYSNFKTSELTLDRCVSPKGTHPRVLLVGDSHAAHYLGMLRAFSGRYGFSLRNITQSACAMVFDVRNGSWVNKRNARGCATYRAAIKAEFSKYDTVIIGSAWEIHEHRHSLAFRLAVKKTLATVASRVKNVIILADVPVMDGYNRDCQIRSVWIPQLQCESRHVKYKKTASINQYLYDLSKNYPNVQVFDIREQLCQKDICSPYVDGASVYYDNEHLSMAGSEKIGEKMLENNDPTLAIFEKIGHLSQ